MPLWCLAHPLISPRPPSPFHPLRSFQGAQKASFHLRVLLKIWQFLDDTASPAIFLNRSSFMVCFAFFPQFSLISRPEVNSIMPCWPHSMASSKKPSSPPSPSLSCQPAHSSTVSHALNPLARAYDLPETGVLSIDLPISNLVFHLIYLSNPMSTGIYPIFESNVSLNYFSDRFLFFQFRY